MCHNINVRAPITLKFARPEYTTVPTLVSFGPKFTNLENTSYFTSRDSKMLRRNGSLYVIWFKVMFQKVIFMFFVT